MLDILWIDAAYSRCLACLDLVHGFMDLNNRRRKGINGGIWRGCRGGATVLKVGGTIFGQWEDKI